MRAPERGGDLSLLMATIAGSHETSTVGRILTVDRQLLGEVEILDGQVDLLERDAKTDLYRSTRATVRDPEGLLDDPALDLMLQVGYRVAVPGLHPMAAPPALIPRSIPFTISDIVYIPQWIETLAFTGPFARPQNRNADGTVALECEDRSHIAMRPGPKKEYKKGANTVATIKKMLQDRGETEFDFPEGNKDKLDDKVVCDDSDEKRTWVQAQKLADGLDMQLIYTTDGVCTLRKYPDANGHAADLTGMFVEGDPEAPSDITNRWVVKGKKPKGKHKKPFTAVADLPNSNPFSPHAMAVNGVNQWENPQTEDNNKLKNQAAVNARAKRLIKKAADDLVEKRTWQGIPVPGLDAMDVVLIGADTHTVRRFSIPLRGGAMSLGYDRRIS